MKCALNWILSLKAPTRALSAGSRRMQELLGGLLQQRNRAGHAAARVEHHDDGDGLDDVLEVDDRLRLVVVEDLEVVLRQIGHEAPLRVGDRDEERHNLGARPEGRLLGAEARQDTRRSRPSAAVRRGRRCRRDIRELTSTPQGLPEAVPKQWPRIRYRGLDRSDFEQVD